LFQALILVLIVFSNRDHLIDKETGWLDRFTGSSGIFGNPLLWYKCLSGQEEFALIAINRDRKALEGQISP
jgi:hypothetical protein